MKKKIQLIGGVMAISASMVMGAVTVNFTNSIPRETDNDIPSSLILSFTVDGAGNVTLHASAPGATPTVTSAVNAWNGPVGTISYAGAFNSKFTLAMYGSRKLKVSEFVPPGGLGVSGVNSFRIDDNGNETITAGASIPAGLLNFSAVSWNNVSGKKLSTMLVTGPSGSVSKKLDDDPGSWDVSAENLKVGNGQALIFGMPVTGDPKAGYTLGGFTFDVIEGSSSGDRSLIIIGSL